MVELSNGCICCSINDEMEAVERLNPEPLDYIVRNHRSGRPLPAMTFLSSELSIAWIRLICRKLRRRSGHKLAGQVIYGDIC